MNIKNQILFIEKFFFLLFLIASFKTNVFAQDIRSGDIIVSRIAGNTYQTKINIYQDLSNFINRTHILLYWGDSSVPDTLQRIDTTIIDSSNGIKVSMYSGIHSYPGQGIYIISYQDSFLLAGITNITNSENEKFCLHDTLSIPVFTTLYNSSPYYSNTQAVSANCCSWSYNSGAVDPDGDSLSYSLVPYPCISDYTYPNDAFIDASTGTLTLSPTSIGKYAIGIKMKEWRKINNNYIIVGSIIRPMLLNVDSLGSVNTIELLPFNIYPNPANNNINVEFISSNENGVIEIQMFNSMGQLITKRNEKLNSSLKFTFDVSSYSKGLYLIQVSTNSNIYFKKIIIQ